jgi:hypothetical protein
MRIGQDFDKIEWQLADWSLLEPNAFIGDSLLFALAIFLAFKVRKASDGTAFYKNWIRFFVVFGVSLFVGGLGHLMWNYWGVTGKYFSWYTAILAVYYIEQAMISLYPKKRIRQGLINWSRLKLILSLLGLSILIFKVDLSMDVSKGLIIPSINSALGMILSLVVLGSIYQKNKMGNFKFFWIGIALLAPSAFFQFHKINFAQWFDRNDVSHVLLALTFICYAIGVTSFRKSKVLLNA